MSNISKNENVQLAALVTLLALAAMLQGCTTINIIFSGTDSGPRPISMGDAGVPMGDGGGIIPIGDAMILDPDGGPVTPDAGTDSGVTVEVDAATGFTVTIEPFNMRQSTILVAGPDIWQNVASFRATSNVASELMEVAVQIDGDPADAHEVAIAVDGVVAGWDVLPAGIDTFTQVVLGTPLPFAAGESRVFQVWTRIPYIQSGASVLGTVDGATRSGDRFRMGVFGIIYRAEATIYSASYGDGFWGNEFIIRKSRPTVTRQTLSSTTLSNGLDQDLYKLQVSADAAGSVGLHTIVFTINPVGGTTVSFDNFRIRRGSTDLPFSDYQIVDAFGRDVRTGSVNLSPSDPNHRVAVVFNYEQVVTGSGNVYTLHATTRGADAGDAVEIYFDRSTGSGATGYLPVDSLHYSLDLSPWGAPGTGFIGTASFIWSDLSETPHSDFYGVGGGSRDWTDLLYVEDLTQVQTLSR